jgi:hypothetical protein
MNTPNLESKANEPENIARMIEYYLHLHSTTSNPQEEALYQGRIVDLAKMFYIRTGNYYRRKER